MNGRTYFFVSVWVCLWEKTIHFYRDAIIWHPTFDTAQLPHRRDVDGSIYKRSTITMTPTTTKHISFKRYNFITTMWVSMRKSLRRNKTRDRVQIEKTHTYKITYETKTANNAAVVSHSAFSINLGEIVMKYLRFVCAWQMKRPSHRFLWMKKTKTMRQFARIIRLEEWKSKWLVLSLFFVLFFASNVSWKNVLMPKNLCSTRNVYDLHLCWLKQRARSTLDSFM